MIVKLIRMFRKKGGIAHLRDNVYALTRYVVDADPWAMAMIERDGARARSLAEYLMDARAHEIEPGEKAGHIGCRNLLADNLGSQQVEMLAVANGAPRVEYLVVHIIVSWQPREKPAPSELEDTVDTVLAMTGLSPSLTLFAQHTNTSNDHLHIASVRVDPATGRAVGSDWLIEDLHQAIAVLEERHGWESEPNALYYARNGAVFDAKARRFVEAQGKKVVDAATEVMVRNEAGLFLRPRHRKGISAEFANLRPNIVEAHAEANDWGAFHVLLEAYQISYRAKGSGARFHFDDKSEKASVIAPELALKQLEKQFGPFVANPRDRIPGFDEYRQAHKEQLKRLRGDRKAAQAVLDTWAKEQLSSVVQARRRLVEKEIQAERDAGQIELKLAFTAAIKICTDARHTTFESWRNAGSPILPPAVPSPALLLPAGFERPTSPPSGLRAEQHRWSTRYYDDADRLVFTDHRSVIVVHRPAEIASLDNALTLAAERWGTVRVKGSETFLQLCAERAVALGITVVADIKNTAGR